MVLLSAEITENLRLIFGRIKMRMAVGQWKKFVVKKKYLRAREEERVMRDRLDFPAANPSNLTTEKVLHSIKGSHGKSPRLNKMDGKSATQWMNIYDRFNSMTEDYSKKIKIIAADMELSANHSKANLENSIPSHSSATTKAKTDLNNYCWKRRWGNDANDDDDLGEDEFVSSTQLKPTKQQRRDDDRRSTTASNLLLDRDSSNSSSSPRCMSPDAKSLLDEMKQFMDEIKKEKEINVDIPMDLLETPTPADPALGNDLTDAGKPCGGFDFSIPDFNVAPKAGEYTAIVNEAEMRTPTRTAALLESLTMFLEETKEEKSKVFLLPPEDLDLNSLK